jgi:hypothetical protein
MTLTRKDAEATVLTGLVVLTFAAAHQGWNVPLIGSSYRWAAVVVFALGAVTCTLGNPTTGKVPMLFMALGIGALAFFVLVLVTGSLTALSLLVADTVALWAATTIRHARHAHATPIVT